MRQLYKNRTLAGLIPALVAGFLSAGCQQPSGPGTAGSLIPANPMSGPTRIPPPPTGSIGNGNAYTQPTPLSGQVSNGLRVNDLVAAATKSPPPSNAAVGSGVLAAADTGSPAPAAPLSPVQQVAYEDSRSGSVASASSQPVPNTGSGLAPMIPADAMVASSYVDTSAPFRPQLRGMQAIDLTPTAPPTLHPVDSGNWAAVDQNQQTTAAAFPSTQPTQRPLSATGSAALSGSSGGSATPTAGSRGATATSNDTSLQWRRPQVAR